MITHFTPMDAVVIGGVAMIAGMIASKSTIMLYEGCGRLVPPSFFVNREVITSLAEQAAVALCYTNYPGLDGLNEFEKNELSTEVQKRTERAIYAYIANVRRKIDAAAGASGEPAKSESE